MHKSTLAAIKNKANVTILKFKASNNLKKNKIASRLGSEEEDPLAITDRDLVVASRNKLPVKKTTLLTPSGIKNIQAIPIELIQSKESHKSLQKNYCIVEENQKPRSNKKSFKVTETLFHTDSEDSDEPLINIYKNDQTKKKKQTNKHNKKRLKKDRSKENKKMMVEKRTQPKSGFKKLMNYQILDRKQVQNKNKPKKCVISKKKKIVQTKKQTKYIEDYRLLIQKYQHLIPARQPYVRISRLQFSAASFTKERPRLSSDINLIRDSAVLYGLFGQIFNYLNLNEKLRSSLVCRLWNRSLYEDDAWFNLQIQNVVLCDLRPLERLILKRESKVILLNNVDIIGKAINFDLTRLSCVRNLIVQKSCSPLLVNKLIHACNDLESIMVPDTNLHVLSNLNTYIKKLNAENMIISESENRLLKKWSDLEKLVVHSFDPRYYYNMGLLLSLRYLKLKKLSITCNIAQFIENIPNIEYIEFSPEYSNICYTEGNKAIVESLKHCPSLKKLTWIAVQEVKTRSLGLSNVIVNAKSEFPLIENMKNINENSCIDNVDEFDANTCKFIEKMEVDNISKTTEIKVKNDVNEESIENIYEKQETIEHTYLAHDFTNATEDDCSKKQSLGDDKTDDGVTYSKGFLIKKECKEEEQPISKNLESIESLQLLSLKTYLKSSLPECEVNFKIINKTVYLD